MDDGKKVIAKAHLVNKSELIKSYKYKTPTFISVVDSQISVVQSNKDSVNFHMYHQGNTMAVEFCFRFACCCLWGSLIHKAIYNYPEMK